MTALAIPVLGLPAMFAAGLASSAHCALMCAPLHARAQGPAAWSRQAGRLTAYALLGALAGGAGQWLLRAQDGVLLGNALRIAALLWMVVLLLRRTRSAARAPCCAAGATPREGVLRSAVQGLLWGLLPCALLYAAAGYALLSGSAAQGALLMLAFGLGTVPALGLGGWAWRAGLSRGGIASTRSVRVASLAWIGAALLAAAVPLALPWCRL